MRTHVFPAFGVREPAPIRPPASQERIYERLLEYHHSPVVTVAIEAGLAAERKRTAAQDAAFRAAMAGIVPRPDQL